MLKSSGASPTQPSTGSHTATATATVAASTSSTSAAPPPPPAGSQAARAQRLKAIGLMCLAVSMFGLLDTTAKYLGTVAQLPTMQVVWVRFFSQLILVMIAFGPLTIPRHLRTTHLALQLIRSLLLLGATVFNFLALQYLRLDQTTTIFFLTPLAIALLAGPVLGEWVGWRRMIAILVGFFGILVAVRPGLIDVHPAFALSIGAMLSYACFSLSTRHLSAFDGPNTTLLYSMLAGLVLVAPFAIAQWVWPQSWFIWLLLASLGLWGGIGHYFFILANRLAPASIVAPFVYIALLSNSVLGYTVFGDLPDGWTLAGASIVISSGLYLLWRERAGRD